MLAASIGSLPIVKLLFEPPYSANDALVAPDGQIALRLAAENDHRAIVDYLPSRRAGGYLRFKTHHARSIERIKNALHQIAVHQIFRMVSAQVFRLGYSEAFGCVTCCEEL
jgi:predicted metal-binding membrane protein